MGFIEINRVLKKTFEKNFTREKIRNTLMNYQLLHEKRLEIHDIYYNSLMNYQLLHESRLEIHDSFRYFFLYFLSFIYF